jgi:hypothetical protein
MSICSCSKQRVTDKVEQNSSQGLPPEEDWKIEKEAKSALITRIKAKYGRTNNASWPRMIHIVNFNHTFKDEKWRTYGFTRIMVVSLLAGIDWGTCERSSNLTIKLPHKADDLL